MAASKPDPGTVKVSKPTSEECELTIKSAKMHLRILQAQIVFLKETNSMSPELQDMLSSLIPSPGSPRGPTGPTEQIATPHTQTPKPEPKIFSTPQHYLAKCNCLGGTVLDVVAKTGDDIIVCGTDNKFALAYNPRNKTAGRIPLDNLQKGKSETVVVSSVYLATSDNPRSVASSTDARILSWARGHHIRVYQWDDPSARPKKGGIAVNLAAKQIGCFSFDGYSLHCIDNNV